MIKAVMIAAVDRGMCLGRTDGSLAHRIPEDLARFKELTMDHALVMGRVTIEFLPPDGLPSRTIFGISSGPMKRIPWSLRWSSTPAEALVSAVEWSARQGLDKVFVCGGAQVYKALAPVCDEAYITRIDRDPPSDPGAHLDIEPWRSRFMTKPRERIAPDVTIGHGVRCMPRPTKSSYELMLSLAENLQEAGATYPDAARLADRWVGACEKLSRKKSDALRVEALEALLNDADSTRGLSA